MTLKGWILSLGALAAVTTTAGIAHAQTAQASAPAGKMGQRLGELRERIAERLGLSRPQYQGVTGVLGVLQATLDHEGPPSIAMRERFGELDAKVAADAAKLAEEQLAAAAKGLPLPAPAPVEPAAVPAPRLRPAFVPLGGMVVALAPEGFTVSTLEIGGGFEGALSPDGTRIVLDADGSHEVRVIALEGGATTTISKDPKATHHKPRFTADGKAVAFTSVFDGNDRAEEVGRLASLGQ